MMPLLFLAFLLLSAPQAMALTIVTEDAPPSTIVRGETLTGSSVEVVREIQKRTGDSSRIEVYPWARAYTMATSEPDVVLFAATRTSEREPLFTWIGPVMRVKWAFFGMAGKARPLASLEDAKKAPSIGAYKDDAREQFLRRQGFTNLDSASSPDKNLRKLQAGRVEYVVSTDTGIGAVLDQAGMKPGDVENVFTFKTVDLYIVFSRGSAPATVAAWEKAFDEMSADGTLKAIQARWYPEKVSCAKEPSGRSN
jgi:polar amino acid transport system substrate-binding protein